MIKVEVNAMDRLLDSVKSFFTCKNLRIFGVSTASLGKVLLLMSLLFACSIPAVCAASPDTKAELPFRRIAVLPFESWNDFASGKTLSDYMVLYITREIPEVMVVERFDLQKIMREQKLSQSGAISPETAISIGKILGVDALMTGKITTLDTILSDQGSITAVCRIIDTSTGQVLWSGKAYASLKPRLLIFDRSYKSPMETAEHLLDQIALQSVEQLKHRFPDTFRTKTASLKSF